MLLSKLTTLCWPLLIAQASEEGLVTARSKSYVLEIPIVLIMVGLALFAVCKTSRRT